MEQLETFKIRKIREADVIGIMERAGGKLAHPDANSRSECGADFILGDAVIELKGLDEEGLEKPERQQKIANIFESIFPDAPVIVIDRSVLNNAQKRLYNRALEGPIKQHVSKANKQLKRTRQEFPKTTTSVLFVLNNGYTTLNQDEFRTLVIERVRNDTNSIDFIVTGGCYLHSDGFDTVALWPLELTPINLGKSFAGFDAMKAAWDLLAEDYMTKMITGTLNGPFDKSPTGDTQFDIAGVTYVKPAPIMGNVSDFYVHGRPRENSSGIECCPIVATSFPLLSPTEWQKFSNYFGHNSIFADSHSLFQKVLQKAEDASSNLVPVVPTAVTFEAWHEWAFKDEALKSELSVFEFANVLFNREHQQIIRSACPEPKELVLAHRHILVKTKIIGRDMANDYSEIFLVENGIISQKHERIIGKPLRVFHEHAVALGAAYALRLDAPCVYWLQDQTHAWI